jgi:hypothetical protein
LNLCILGAALFGFFFIGLEMLWHFIALFA